MSEAAKKQLPSITDIMFLAGICQMGVGISFHWGWPVACEVVGCIVFCVAIAAKLRGHS